MTVLFSSKLRSLYALVALMSPLPALAVEIFDMPERRYYAADDTVVAVPEAVSAFVVEMRAALPDMKEGRGPSADCWGMADASGQWALLHGFNSDYGSELDRRGLRLIYGVTDASGRRAATDSVDIYSGVDAMRGFNTMSMEWRRNGAASGADDCRLNIYVGNDEPRLAMSVAAPMVAGPVSVIGFGRREVQTLMTEWSVNAREALFTGWTRDALDSRLASSVDPLEGFWSYFDRRTDDDRARLGGKYRLAVVGAGAPGCYDILYVDGAVTGADVWRAMMLKGRLTPARFEHMWRLDWYDAMGIPLDDDESYATFSPVEGVLTLEFPIYRSRIRFAKD